MKQNKTILVLLIMLMILSLISGIPTSKSLAAVSSTTNNAKEFYDWASSGGRDPIDAFYVPSLGKVRFGSRAAEGNPAYDRFRVLGYQVRARLPNGTVLWTIMPQGYSTGLRDVNSVTVGDYKYTLYEFSYPDFINRLKSQFSGYSSQIDLMPMSSIRLDAVFSIVHGGSYTPSGSLNSAGVPSGEVYLTLGKRYTSAGTNTPDYHDPNAVRFNNSVARYTSYDRQTRRNLNDGQFWNGIRGGPQFQPRTRTNFANYFNRPIQPDGTDTKAPTISYDPNSSSWTNKSIAVAIKATDDLCVEVLNYKYYKEGNSSSASWVKGRSGQKTTTTNVTLSSTGKWQITAEAYDISGHKGTRTSGWYYIDKESPSGKFSPNSQAWTNSNVSVQFTPSDSGGSGVKRYRTRTSSNNGSNYGSWSGWTNGAGNKTINLTTQGQHKIQAQVEDNAGNSTTITSGTYRIDKTAPGGTFSPNSKDWGNANVSVSFTPSDSGGSGVKRYRTRTSSNNGSSYGSWSGYTTGSGKKTISLSAAGQHKIQTQVEDNAGNSTTITSGTYRIDKTPPSATFNPKNKDWGNQNVSVVITPSDSGGSGVSSYVYTTYKDNTRVTEKTVSGSGTTTLTFSAEGVHRAEVTVTDKAGNKSSVIKSGDYKVDKTMAQHLKHSITGQAYKDGNDYWFKGNTVGVFTDQARDTLSGLHILYSRFRGLLTSFDSRSRHRIANNDTADNDNWMRTNDSLKITAANRKGNINTGLTIDWTFEVNNNENDYDVMYYYVDKAGNRYEDRPNTTNAGYDSTGLKVRVDSTVPEIKSNLKEQSWTNNDLDLKLTYSDKRSGIKTKQYVWTKDPGSSAAWKVYDRNLSLKDEGIWYLQARAVDNVGYEKRETFGPYKVDKTPPDIYFRNKANTKAFADRDWSDEEVEVVIVILDPYIESGVAGSGVAWSRYAWTESEEQPSRNAPEWSHKIKESEAYLVTQPETGIWYLHVETEDVAGNYNYRYGGSYKVDTSVPVITFEGSEYMCDYDNTIKVLTENTFSGITETRFSFSKNPDRPRENKTWDVEERSVNWATGKTTESGHFDNEIVLSIHDKGRGDIYGNFPGYKDYENRNNGYSGGWNALREGTWYLHIHATDRTGRKFEVVSPKITINKLQNLRITDTQDGFWNEVFLETRYLIPTAKVAGIAPPDMALYENRIHHNIGLGYWIEMKIDSYGFEGPKDMISLDILYHAIGEEGVLFEDVDLYLPDKDGWYHTVEAMGEEHLYRNIVLNPDRHRGEYDTGYDIRYANQRWVDWSHDEAQEKYNTWTFKFLVPADARFVEKGVPIDQIKKNHFKKMLLTTFDIEGHKVYENEETGHLDYTRLEDGWPSVEDQLWHKDDQLSDKLTRNRVSGKDLLGKGVGHGEVVWFSLYRTLLDTVKYFRTW